MYVCDVTKGSAARMSDQDNHMALPSFVDRCWFDLLDPRARNIRQKASSRPGIFFRTLPYATSLAFAVPPSTDGPQLAPDVVQCM